MKIAFTAAHNPLAQEAFAAMTRKYGQCAPKDADCIVSLGGDGHALQTLHAAMDHGKPVFALRLKEESVGFLCNEYQVEGLEERLAKAQKVILHPLRAEVQKTDGKTEMILAINEVTTIRTTPQSAKLRISVDGVERIHEFCGDGIIIATPAGSPAYNHSARGPIMPLDSNTLAMTPICVYSPAGWRPVVLPQNVVIEIEVLELPKRPVRIEADMRQIFDAKRVKIWLDRKQDIALLFDPEQHLGEKIIREQFTL